MAVAGSVTTSSSRRAGTRPEKAMPEDSASPEDDDTAGSEHAAAANTTSSDEAGSDALSREQLAESQKIIQKEHEALILKYRKEKQRLINKELELTGNETHPKLEKEIAQLAEGRERRLRQSERIYDASVAVIKEQYESRRSQIDADYTAAMTELEEENLEESKKRRLMASSTKKEEL